MPFHKCRTPKQVIASEKNRWFNANGAAPAGG
jgi:hypothetical protein